MFADWWQSIVENDGILKSSCLINKSQFSSDRELLAQRSKRAILHFAHGSFAASKKVLTKHCISLAICLSPPYDGDSWQSHCWLEASLKQSTVVNIVAFTKFYYCSKDLELLDHRICVNHCFVVHSALTTQKHSSQLCVQSKK